jgi:tRNA dimethylallyltransferase
MDKRIIGIVGPTASGKTTLAVALARELDAEIISADSRQVYKGMDIGTGKDLAEYQGIHYHLIDVVEAGDKYNVRRFQGDFAHAIDKIGDREIILCGGSGMYVQSVVEGFSYTAVPENPSFRAALQSKTKEDLQGMGAEGSTHKRMVRSLEIQAYLKAHPDFRLEEERNYYFTLFGLNPPVGDRRAKISQRLKFRLNKQYMMQEVEGLVAQGVEHETLEYYGLEYKYISLFLRGFLRYDEMCDKLETEIHRFAKRQMTFFRSMEKKGIPIDWVPEELSLKEKVDYIKERSR